MLRAAETIQLTDTGRQRRDNEDSMYARAPVFVVADGMGGAQAGEVASRLAVEAFEQGLPDEGSPEERLATRIQEANTRIYELSRAEHERAGMGTTLTAAYLGDAHLAIAHVGDSRAYLYRGGKLTRLTQDHSLVGELVRRGKLTEEQAEEHPQRSIITRALGPEPFVEVDTWSYPAHHGDVLLLCSDGLTSMINEAKIAGVLASTNGLGEAADRLIAEANAAGGRDNITVVLSRIEEVGEIDDGLAAPTMVGARAASGPAAAGAGAGAGASEPTPPPGSGSEAGRGERPETRVATSAPEARGGSLAATLPAVKVPLARTQGSPSQAPPRRPRRFVKSLAALTATLIVLGLVGAGGYLASRQLYFIGTNSQGIVTIYRGFPYDLPANIHFYETFYVSGVPAAQVPPDRRHSLFNEHLRSQADAESLVRALELGQLAR